MNSKLRLISLVFGLSSLISFTACTDYQEEFDNNFGALEYADDSGEIPVIDSSPSGDIQSSSDENSNDSVSSSVDDPLSSAIPASSGEEQSSSSKGKSSSSEKTKESSSSGKGLSSSSAKSSSSSQSSSSSAESSSSMKSSSSLAYHFQLPIHEIPYNVVTIGKQTWMADNMAKENPTFYYPKGDPNIWKYGRLYDWSTAKEICPEGWHLPDSLEWQTLFDAVGGIEVAGKVLQSSNVYGTGEEMFAGFRNSYGEFLYFDKYADFWINDDSGVKFVELQRGASKAFFMPNPEYMPDNLTGYAYSVRCIMDYITDERDGQTYRTVKIGDQVWMAENMNADEDGSVCYRDSSKYCDVYGRLYSWDAAMKVCPEGWRLPDTTDWSILFKSVGGKDNAATHLKATSSWDSNGDGNGDDKFGFSAFAAGGSDTGSDLKYAGKGNSAAFWTSEVKNSYDAWGVGMYWADSYPTIDEGSLASNRRSVRCIKD